MKAAAAKLGSRNHRRRAPWAGALLLALTLPAAAFAGSWPPDGKAIAEQGIAGVMPSCAACHGSEFRGEANAGGMAAPSLRGKTAADLMDDLYDIAQNSRNHSKMAWIARHLDMSQRAAVTAYIAGLSAKSD